MPRAVLNQLDLEVGDSLQVVVSENKAVLTPKKQLALNALTELQRLVQESGVTEPEMQANATRIRERLNETRVA